MEISQSASMVKGGIAKHLIKFSIPLFLGNLFQLLYSTIDSVIVGQYVGEKALAAVGASSPIINLMIGFFMGIASGAGVVASRFYGSNNHADFQKTLHTFLLFTIYCAIFLTVIGVGLSTKLLLVFNTPMNIMQDAVIYLQIYFAGVILMMVYNSGAGLLRAVGDSKRPLYFLIVSSVINIVLDLYFVIYLKMGVAGVGLATLISQGVSAIMVLYVLFTGEDFYRIHLNKLKIDKVVLNKILKIGIPAGLQQVIVSFSNVLVQGYVNTFDYAAIAGFSSANKIDNILGLPINSLAIAMTTFTGQNVGAKKVERVEKGVRINLIIMFVSVSLIGLFAFINAEQCIALFSNNADVIYYGSLMMRTVVPFYVILGITQILTGAIRGAGVSTVPMIINIICFCVIRQIFLSIAMPIFNNIEVVFWSYSFTWAISAIITVIYYNNGTWKRASLAF